MDIREVTVVRIIKMIQFIYLTKCVNEQRCINKWVRNIPFMVKFIVFHITKNVHLEMYIPFLFESMKKLSKGVGKILKKSIYIISSMHIHILPYVCGNCGEFFICMHTI